MTDDQPHVLVVDDDRRLRELLRGYLSQNGFLVTTAADAAEARARLAVIEFDLAVMDVMMPGEDGLALTRALRGGTVQRGLPVLLLTARGGPDDRIDGLEAGADDYLGKPFEPRELVLRIQSILRRRPAAPPPAAAAAPTLMRFGRWIYDPAREELKSGPDSLRLTTAEATLLKALAATPGQAISREALCERTGLVGQDRTIDAQVTRLRRKIEADPADPRILLTVRGQGYLLRPD